MTFSESEGGPGDHWICSRPLRSQGDPKNLWLCGWCQKGGRSYGDCFLWLRGLPDSNPDSFAPCSVSPLFLMFPPGPGLFLTILLFLHICLAKFLSFFLFKQDLHFSHFENMSNYLQSSWIHDQAPLLTWSFRKVSYRASHASRCWFTKKKMRYHLKGTGES